MITSIISATDPNGWSVSEFEHEVAVSGDRVADLKATYGIDSLCVGVTALTLLMRDEESGSNITMRWDGLTELGVETTGPNVPAEDGRSGIIGIRLMRSEPYRLDFEIETDWLRFTVTARKFVVLEGTDS